MSKIHANYCGYFSIKNSDIAFPAPWQPVVESERDIAEYKQYYYPEFVDFALANDTNGCRRYRLTPAESNITVTLKFAPVEITVKRITAYIMPHDILIYAIETEAEADDLNTLTLITSHLRSIYNIDSEPSEKTDLTRFIETAINPVKALFTHFNGTECASGDLVEKGNKFKVFQVIDTPLEELSAEERKIMLFEFGTMSVIGGFNANDIHSITREYMEEVLDGSSISIYNNWSGVALLDSFTILACQFKEYNLDTWLSDYFSMIYIHNLFIKFYLFRLNERFRAENRDTDALGTEFAIFERNYCFKKISYNFLPLEIAQMIDKALEINEEKEILCHEIELENQRNEKESDKRMNNLLFFLTCITMFSTVWDATCLLDQLFSYEGLVGDTTTGYRSFSLGLSVIIIVIAVLILRRRKEKKK